MVKKENSIKVDQSDFLMKINHSKNMKLIDSLYQCYGDKKNYILYKKNDNLK